MRVIESPRYRYAPSLRWAIKLGPFAEPIGYVVSDDEPHLPDLPLWLKLTETARLDFAGPWMP